MDFVALVDSTYFLGSYTITVNALGKLFLKSSNFGIQGNVTPQDLELRLGILKHKEASLQAKADDRQLGKTLQSWYITGKI